MTLCFDIVRKQAKLHAFFFFFLLFWFVFVFFFSCFIPLIKNTEVGVSLFLFHVGLYDFTSTKVAT